MKLEELMALHSAATPGAGHTDHDERWEEFANAAWWCLPQLTQELLELRRLRHLWLEPQAIVRPDPTLAEGSHLGYHVAVVVALLIIAAVLAIGLWR